MFHLISTKMFESIHSCLIKRNQRVSYFMFRVFLLVWRWMESGFKIVCIFFLEELRIFSRFFRDTFKIQTWKMSRTLELKFSFPQITLSKPFVFRDKITLSLFMLIWLIDYRILIEGINLFVGGTQDLSLRNDMGSYQKYLQRISDNLWRVASKNRNGNPKMLSRIPKF